MSRDKENKKGDINVPKGYDNCQTPFYALDPLIPYLPKRIWESAAGEGNIVRKLELEDFNVISSDIITGQNFFSMPTPIDWDCQVTNPPYSVKYEWLSRSYSLSKPFALLLPFETWAARKGNKLFEQYGVEVIILNPRVNFKMPNKGYDGGGAQFSTAWFTWGLGIGRTVSYAQLCKYEDGQLPLNGI